MQVVVHIDQRGDIQVNTVSTVLVYIQPNF